MRTSLAFLSLLTACFAEPPRDPAPPSAPLVCGAAAVAPIRWIASSTFIFRGTVTRVHATTLPPGDRDLSRSVVVRIDAAIVRARDIDELHDTWGRELTVELSGAALPVGATATFFTITREYNGGQLAVAELGRATRADAAAIVRARAALDADAAYKAIATSEAIVAGRVTAIRAWPHAGPISEHDPGWAIATVAVEHSACGSAPATVASRDLCPASSTAEGRCGSIDVGFPASNDVAWFRRPKLHVGDDGVFLLHAGGAFAPPLVVVEPLDVRARGELAMIVAALANPPLR